MQNCEEEFFKLSSYDFGLSTGIFGHFYFLRTRFFFFCETRLFFFTRFYPNMEALSCFFYIFPALTSFPIFSVFLSIVPSFYSYFVCISVRVVIFIHWIVVFGDVDRNEKILFLPRNSNLHSKKSQLRGSFSKFSLFAIRKKMQNFF